MPRFVEGVALAGVLSLGIATLTTQRPSGVHVCVGTDRVLRLAGAEDCPAGQAAYLTEAGGDQRVEHLEATLTDQDRIPEQRFHRFVVPFEVDDSAGNSIFKVKADPRGFVVQLPSGAVEAVATALPTGGFFKVLGPDQDLDLQGVLGVNGKQVLVTVRQGRTPRATLSFDADGKPRIQIQNPSGVGIGVLTQGARGDGLLQLLSFAGRPTVEAGTAASGEGQVQTGPAFGCSGASGMLGLKLPNCIKGNP